MRRAGKPSGGGKKYWLNWIIPSRGEPAYAPYAVRASVYANGWEDDAFVRVYCPASWQLNGRPETIPPTEGFVGQTLIFRDTHTHLDGREMLVAEPPDLGAGCCSFVVRVLGIKMEDMPMDSEGDPGYVKAAPFDDDTHFVIKGEEPVEERRCEPAEERRCEPTEEEREEEVDDQVLKVLQKFDRDGSGCLDMKEFGQLLQCLDSAAWPDNKIRELFAETDADVSGSIEVEELMDWLSGVSAEDKTAVFQANPSRLCDDDYDTSGEDSSLDGLLNDSVNPRLSLKRAMAAFPPDLKRALKKPAWFARKFARSGKCKDLMAKYSGLDADGAQAIYLYTMETPLYKVLNAQLRSSDRTNPSFRKQFYPYSRILIEALRSVAASDPEKQTLNRGVRLDLVAKNPDAMRTDETRIFWSFTSCTASADALSNPTFLGTAGDRTLFQISTRKGAPIGEFSSYPEEAEYLLPPGTVLTMKGVLPLGGGLTLVQLEDDDEAPDLLADW